MTDYKQNVVSILLEQHDELRRCFDEVAHGAGAERAHAFSVLCELLDAHEAAEERVVYPALMSVSDLDQEIVALHLHQEGQARRDLLELYRIGPSSLEFELAFKSFRASVEVHADSEEATLFPRLLRAFDSDELENLADALRQSSSSRS